LDEESGVLLGVSLLDVALGHLLHEHVGVNVDLLPEDEAVGVLDDAPLAGDDEGTDRGLGVDEGVDTVLQVGDGQLVGGLANGLLVGDGVGGGLTKTDGAGLKVVGDEGRAEGLDHEVVVVDGGEDGGLVNAGRDGSGDDGGRHFCGMRYWIF
ncbi:hypothetical protein CI238_11013, partial [Colletotrichum incanum]